MFSSRPLRRLALPATLAAASLLVAGCASGPEVRADYDHAADFGKYRTYGFVSQTTPSPIGQSAPVAPVYKKKISTSQSPGGIRE